MKSQTQLSSRVWPVCRRNQFSIPELLLIFHCYTNCSSTCDTKWQSKACFVQHIHSSKKELCYTLPWIFISVILFLHNSQKDNVQVELRCYGQNGFWAEKLYFKRPPMLIRSLLAIFTTFVLEVNIIFIVVDRYKIWSLPYRETLSLNSFLYKPPWKDDTKIFKGVKNETQ